MNSPRIAKYLQKYGASGARPLVATSVDGVETVVVIPVLAELPFLFRTLASISANPSSELRRTLIICVVNNHRPGLAEEAEIRDNQKTLSILKSLVFPAPILRDYPDEMQDDDLRKISSSGLRLAFIDASSPGLEISDRDGGVGMARKIGMDAALGLMGRAGRGKGVICSLDADTLVQKNYLSAVDDHFKKVNDPGCVIAYAHQKPVDTLLLAAISCYEIFLRAYVMGLSYAGSPYAFHTIGSTMICTTEGYLGVRGMNRRTAGEDFHFLNKLAKTGKIGVSTETIVFPSSRPSERVPFGTGRRVLSFITDRKKEYRFYAPEIFEVLRRWLGEVKADPDRDPEAILLEARRVHIRLEEYLRLNRFDTDWRLIRRNSRDSTHLRRQFHVWFDGLRTLRLIRYLSRSVFPTVPLFEGLKDLADRMGQPILCDLPAAGVIRPEEQARILDVLRSSFPCS